MHCASICLIWDLGSIPNLNSAVLEHLVFFEMKRWVKEFKMKDEHLVASSCGWKGIERV